MDIRIRAALLAMAAGIGALVARGVPARGDNASPHFEEARIPHQDRSGRATIVEIDPRVPGARQFLAATPERIPDRGELVTPVPTTPLSSPSPALRPGY